MTKRAPLQILTGETVHERRTPFAQRFRYGLFMVEVDIDRLDEAGRTSHLFAIDRPALYSLRRRDHGAREDAPLRPWALRQLQRAGVNGEDATIRLVTFPRHLFYRFAPLSIWFADGPDGAPRGVIYEVNNTFGDTHSYVARIDAQKSVHEADKRFHVSPFFDVTGRYRFSLKRSDAALGLVIDTLVDGRRTHMATIAAQRRKASSAAFARAALLRPLSSIGVTAGIHFEALKIWLRGAGYRARPKPPDDGPTVADSPTK